MTNEEMINREVANAEMANTEAAMSEKAIEQILLTVAYDGTDYCGWQAQSEVLAVQEVVQQRLMQLFGADLTTLGASRTDGGVHALGQRMCVRLPIGVCQVPLDKLPEVINARLPKDVTVVHAQRVPDWFHPIFHAKRKTYTYTIQDCKHANPLMWRYSYHSRVRLDAEAMNRAAALFVGEHDFEAFRAMGGTTKTSVRTMYAADVRRDGDLVWFTVTGSGFLYNMVRIMTGTLMSVGEGKMAAEEIPALLASRDRTRAGRTVPPQGLTLVRVEYDCI